MMFANVFANRVHRRQSRIRAQPGRKARHWIWTISSDARESDYKIASHWKSTADLSLETQMHRPTKILLASSRVTESSCANGQREAITIVRVVERTSERNRKTLGLHKFQTVERIDS